ncbi:hypothetical protein [Sphingopyxis sp.]|uniref:hypothetical protein n=1 Tax=Sphingopyxis sp. TaxID=1908224 RepID=UPI002ED90F6C
MYRKTDWNFSRYEEAVFARPCDPETVMYAALDFCIAIVGLRDWTKKALVRKMRQDGSALPASLAMLDDFAGFVTSRVHWQPAIEAIANTAKHAEYRDTGWEKGIASPASFFPDYLRAEHEACADGLQLFAFMHKYRQVTWWDLSLRQHGDQNATPGYEALGGALDQWGSLLAELGYPAE